MGVCSCQQNREFAFLCACARRLVDPHAPMAIPSDLNWTRVIEQAADHLLLPSLAWVVTEAGAAPPDILAELRQRFQANARLNLTLTSELLRLLQAFDSAHLPVIPLKGPALAEHLYGDVTLRGFSDLDLLVQPEHVLAARQLLEESGYQLTSTLHWNSKRAVLRARDSQVAFHEPRTRIAIDLHWRLMPGYFPSAVEDRAGWREVRTRALAGVPVKALAPEQLLLFLCAHSARHHWERLGWICDIACLLRAEREWDWDSVFRQAKAFGTQRILAVSLLLAETLAGAPLDDQAARRIAPNPTARALADEVRLRLQQRTPGAATAMESARFLWKTIESPARAVAALLGIFLAPTEAEFRAIQLPGALYGLYYPFRLVRLSFKYALELKARRQQRSVPK